MNFREASTRARERIVSHVRKTPLEYSFELSELTGANVYLKLENQQLTGSFKLRGAMNKILSLSEAERKRGVVAASTGNHGAGVAHALASFGVDGEIFVPSNALQSKVDAIRKRGAKVRIAGKTCEEAEQLARAHAEASHRVFVSPYNDSEVVAGQGTIGLELDEQGPAKWDALFVSVGGGGLIAGIAGVMKQKNPALRVYACSPEVDCAMERSLKAGRIVGMDARPTLSDGTAGAVEAGSITFDFCRNLVDEFVLVDERSIGAWVLWALKHPKLLIEGAAAVPIAALVKQGKTLAGKNVVVVLCGGNLGFEILAGLIDGEKEKAGALR